VTLKEYLDAGNLGLVYLRDPDNKKDTFLAVVSDEGNVVTLDDAFRLVNLDYEVAKVTEMSFIGKREPFSGKTSFKVKEKYNR
jgi:hypothetical protein